MVLYLHSMRKQDHQLCLVNKARWGWYLGYKVSICLKSTGVNTVCSPVVYTGKKSPLGTTSPSPCYKHIKLIYTVCNYFFPTHDSSYVTDLPWLIHLEHSLGMYQNGQNAAPYTSSSLGQTIEDAASNI